MIALLEMLRPQQWYKNLVVFIGIVFSSNLFDAGMFWKVMAAFFLVSVLSGVNYIINDINDLERDRSHPTKKNRPLPSGKVSKSAAWIFAAILSVVVFYSSSVLSINFFYLMIIFFALGLLYSFYLKNIFLVDIIMISINFVLRAIMGNIVNEISTSTWLIIMAFLFALVLAATKRKGEIYLLGQRAAEHRKNIEKYDSQILDYISIFSLTSLFISYTIYAIIVRAGTYFAATFPLVIYIIFKYLIFIVKTPEQLALPEKFLFNRSVLVAGILLALITFAVFYLPIQQLIKT